MIELFEESVKKLIQERAKFIEDYMKFWLAVNADLDTLTVEFFANNYALIIIQEDRKTTYAMLDTRKDIIIEKAELERLRRLYENIQERIQSIKDSIPIITNEIGIKSARKEILYLESLYKVNF